MSGNGVYFYFIRPRGVYSPRLLLLHPPTHKNSWMLERRSHGAADLRRRAAVRVLPAPWSTENGHEARRRPVHSIGASEGRRLRASPRHSPVSSLPHPPPLPPLWEQPSSPLRQSTPRGTRPTSGWDFQNKTFQVKAIQTEIKKTLFRGKKRIFL